MPWSDTVFSSNPASAAHHSQYLLAAPNCAGTAAEKGVMPASRAENKQRSQVLCDRCRGEKKKKTLNNTDQFEESPTDFALGPRK